MKKILSNVPHYMTALVLLGFIFAPPLFAQTVLVTPFAVVPTNTAVGVEVVPEPPTQTVSLELRNLSGEGSAIFATNSETSLSVTQACVVLIRGTLPSSVPNNLVLEVRLGQNQITSNQFTVITNSMLTPQEVTETARSAVQGKADIQPNAPVQVSLSGSSYVVTFGIDLPANALGPSYVARVELDAFSGQVLSVLGGP